MDNFIFNGFDYNEYIKTDEDLKLFNRLRELEPELYKPASECFEAVKEVVNIERKLKGLPPAKFIHVNPNADLLN